MKKADVVNYFGNEVKVAKALGITKGAVNQWSDRIPLARAYQIEKITKGALKVDGDPLFKQAS